jgi:flagellum-specific peptidoglycan hydrolase FlgJ
MNPIFQKMQQHQQGQQQPNLNALFSIKNPKDYVLNALGNMSPEQLKKVQSMLPMAQRIAQKSGINLDVATNAINNLIMKG